MRTIYAALKSVMAEPRYRTIGALGFVLSLALYLLTLPSAYIGGRLSLDALPYLTPYMIVVSVIMAALVAMIVTLMVFLVARRRSMSKASTAGGLLIGIATPVLCCSPLLPMILGFIAIFFPSLVSAIGWRAQWFIATHDTELYSAAAAFLILGLYQNARRVLETESCQPVLDVA